MKYYTDNPILKLEDDQFGYAKYATVLTNIIVETKKLPFTIGVFGDWGSGKTSLMKLIDNCLVDIPDIKTIWFNPWKYDGKEALWNAMIQSILSSIILEGGMKKGIKEKAMSLAKTAGWLIFKQGVTTTSGGIISQEQIEKLKRTLMQDNLEHYQKINRFEEHFEEVVSEYANGGKLIIFVDDLDRCMPESAITILESLKLFIGNANCVFVLSMDYRVIEEGINNNYGNSKYINGKKYIDKIIQIPFFIPTISFDKLRKWIENYNGDDIGETVWMLIEYAFAANPRKIMRFINCYNIVMTIMDIKSQKTRKTKSPYKKKSRKAIENQKYYLAKLLILQLQYSKFYSYLEKHCDAWEKIETKVIPASSEEIMLREFDDDIAIRELWNDYNFRIFMKSTATSERIDIPKPPDGKLVKVLMSDISIIGIT